MDEEGCGWLAVLVGVANKINELAPVEGNLPSSLVMMLLRHAPGSVCMELLHTVNRVCLFMQDCVLMKFTLLSFLSLTAS